MFIVMKERVTQMSLMSLELYATEEKVYQALDRRINSLLIGVYSLTVTERKAFK